MSAGHNSVDAGQLRALVERAERVNSERDALALDLRDIYAEAKSQGFDVPVLRKVIRKRAQIAKDRSKVEISDEIFDLYISAVGDAP